MGLCSRIFKDKMKEYGVSWRGMSDAGLRGMILIKLRRVMAIQSGQTPKVDEPIGEGFMAIINYSIIAILRRKMPKRSIQDAYQAVVQKNRVLLAKKNHDYGDVWREMDTIVLLDIIVAKLSRIDHALKTTPDKPLPPDYLDNYYDIINYAFFCFLKTEENTK